jgi:predicted nucleotidyltransferase component of viral defense system
MPEPKRPNQLSDYAARTLQSLAAEGLGHKISLGGALGLLHYLDYRSTHDVDAWWSPSVTGEDRERVLRTIQTSLQPFGEVGTRSWGEVVSVELRIAGKKVFSFQVASRSAQLNAPERLPWADVSLDSLNDLIASKMTALVERGAPRDFRDIYTLCDRGLTSAGECWTLWAERQQMAGSDADRNRARLAVQTHLARIAQYRPLDTIADAAQLEEASRVRSWFEKDFLNALLD